MRLIAHYTSQYLSWHNHLADSCEQSMNVLLVQKNAEIVVKEVTLAISEGFFTGSFSAS
jgi:hypothetical protein